MQTDKSSADDAALASEIFGADRAREPERVDDGGTRETPAPEPKAEVKAEVKAPVGDEEAKQPREPNGRYTRQVPLAALEEERGKRTAVQTERDAIKAERDALNARIKELETSSRATADSELAKRLEALERRTNQPQQQQQRQQKQEDDEQLRILDPAAYADKKLAEVQQRLEQARLNDALWASEENERAKSGDAIVDAAVKAATDAGILGSFAQFGRRCYGELVKWHRNQETLKRVGSDPEAYEKTLLEKAREQLLADLKAGKVTLDGAPSQQQQQRPTASARPPVSLAGATSSAPPGNGHIPQSDDAMAKDIFGSSRHRRA